MVADFKSILIYFGALLATLFITFVHFKRKKNGVLDTILFVLLASLPLAIVAGLRADSVGTDTYNYRILFRVIIDKTFFECLFQRETGILFAIIIKVFSLISSDDIFLLFIIEYITLIVLFLTIIKLKDKLNPILLVTLYFLLFYHSSLNIIRQGLALSLVLLMLALILEKKYLKALLVIFIAFLIHTSAIITLLFIPIAVFFSKNNGFNSRTVIHIVLLLLMVVFFVLFFNQIVNMGIFSDYQKYEINSDNISFLRMGVLITFLLYFLPSYFICWKTIKNNREVRIIFYVATTYLPFAFLGYISEYATRLNLYSMIAICLMIPLLIKNETNKQNKTIITIFYICIIVFSYIVNYLIANQTGAFPYVFR